MATKAAGDWVWDSAGDLNCSPDCAGVDALLEICWQDCLAAKTVATSLLAGKDRGAALELSCYDGSYCVTSPYCVTALLASYLVTMAAIVSRPLIMSWRCSQAIVSRFPLVCPCS